MFLCSCAVRPLARLVPMFLLLVASAAAQPLETAIPAGQRGRLAVAVTVEGEIDGQPIDRRIAMDLHLLSEETAAFHLLMADADEDLQVQMEHQEALGEILAGGGEKMLALGRAIERLVAACEGAEESAACAAAQAEVEAANAPIDATRDAAEAHDEAAPEMTSQHRYQPWMSAPDRTSDVLCGTIQVRVHDGADDPVFERTLPEGDPATDFSACGTTMVIDRRGATVTLGLASLRIAGPGEEWDYGSGEVIDWSDLDPSEGVESDPWAGRIVIRDMPIDGSADAFSGEWSHESSRGITTTVTWTFAAE